jgi:hypothetical protein
MAGQPNSVDAKYPVNGNAINVPILIPASKKKTMERVSDKGSERFFRLAGLFHGTYH